MVTQRHNDAAARRHSEAQELNKPRRRTGVAEHGWFREDDQNQARRQLISRPNYCDINDGAAEGVCLT